MHGARAAALVRRVRQMGRPFKRNVPKRLGAWVKGERVSDPYSGDAFPAGHYRRRVRISPAANGWSISIMPPGTCGTHFRDEPAKTATFNAVALATEGDSFTR